MKRVIGVVTATVLLGSTVAYADDSSDGEIGINMGGTSIYGAKMSNYTMGINYKSNEDFNGIKPRVDLDYVNVSDYKKGNVKALYKGSINGVYEFKDAKNAKVQPYAVFGVGYEKVDGAVKDVFDSNAFAHGGLGVSYKTRSIGKVNVEGKALQIIGAKGQNNEYSLTAGISVPLTLDGDECPIKIDGPDEDRDGVLDSVDQCPNTPCYFTVDKYGCPVKATLRLHFDFNKWNIKPAAIPKVIRFADYLKSHPGTHVTIVGHTDSIGSRAYNQWLSEKRANSVLKKLVELGVSPARLTAIGKGEDEPVASNATPEGRALNRRIEAKLSYDDPNYNNANVTGN